MAMTVAQLMVKIGAEVGDALRAMDEVSNRLTSFGKQAAITGGMLTAGVTLPLVGVAKSALDTAMSYESALNMMQAVSGATGEQMQRVAQAAKALGADMTLPATSAADAARAMTELAKAGLNVEQSIAAAKGVLQLAAAGHLSEARAAEIAANALNAFGLAGEKATDVANLLAAAANASSIEVYDAADAFKMASATFSAFQGPIVGSEQAVRDLTTAVAILGNVGIKGSDAGTSLKQMLLQLTGPSDKAKAAMRALYIAAQDANFSMSDLSTVLEGTAKERLGALQAMAKGAGFDVESMGDIAYDASGKMRPLREIVDLVAKATKNMSDEQRNMALTTIFGADATRAIIALLRAGEQGWNDMATAVTRQGAAADLAGARMKGLAGALQGLQSQVEAVLLEVAEPFLTTLEGWARGLADLIPRITEIDPNIRNAALAFAAVIAAAGPAVLVFGALATVIGVLASPIGLVVAALAALAAAYAGNLLGMRDLTNEVVGQMVGWVQSNWPLVQQTVQTTMQAVQTVVQTVLGIVQRVWGEHSDAILSRVATVWNGILAAIQTVLQTVVPFVLEQLGVIVSWTEANWPLIQQTIETVSNAILVIITVLLDQILMFWNMHGEIIIMIVSSIWTIISTIVSTAIYVILNTIRTAMQIINGDWSGAWETMQGIIAQVWEAIQVVIIQSLIIIGSVLTLAWAGIKSGVETQWQQVLDIIRSTWDSIVSIIRERINTIIAQINRMIDAWNNLGFHVPGFDVELPSAEVPGVGRVGGGRLAWGGINVETPDLAPIPLLGTGGVVTRPTLALLGEAGPEAVLPLGGSRLDALAERIADAVASRPTYTINANYRYQDERSLRDDLRLLQMLGAAT